MAALDIVRIPVLSDNYVWLVHDPASEATMVVDPAVAEPVLAAAAERGWTITDIWNTHWHPDHTGGNTAIKEATGCTTTGPAAAIAMRSYTDCRLNACACSAAGTSPSRSSSILT